MMVQARHVASRRLTELLAGVVTVNERDDRQVFGLSMDSRSAAAGDLFFACAGTRGHGLQYLRQALQAGVAAVIWEPCAGWTEVPAPFSDSGDVPFFALPELGTQVGVIADRFFGAPSHHLRVVGVTGTDGKTSCTQFLARCLDRPQARCGVIGTLGYGFPGALSPASHTTPDAIRLQRLLADMVAADARCVAMEVSSHALEQGRASGVAFDVAVLTNLGRDHLDYHGDELAYARAKRRLFEQPGLKTAVLNLNDAFGRELAERLSASVECVGYGIGPLASNEQLADHVIGSDLRLSADGLSMQVRSPWGSGHIRARLLGRFNASNVLAVLTVLLVGRMPFEQASAAIADLTTVPGRMEVFGGEAEKPRVVVDYAHTPQALQQVLESLREHCGGRLWCVFGCGGDRDRGKRPLMGALAERLCDETILTDDNPRSEDANAIIAEILNGMRRPERARVQRDRAAAIALAVNEAGADDIVLVAGKGHEQVQRVGDRELPFSDRQQVAAALAQRGGA